MEKLGGVFRNGKRVLKQYEEVFGEKFPIFYLCHSGEPDGVFEEIKKAIKTKKPYHPEIEEVDGRPVTY